MCISGTNTLLQKNVWIYNLIFIKVTVRLHCREIAIKNVASTFLASTSPHPRPQFINAPHGIWDRKVDEEMLKSETF